MSGFLNKVFSSRPTQPKNSSEFESVVSPPTEESRQSQTSSVTTAASTSYAHTHTHTHTRNTERETKATLSMRQHELVPLKNEASQIGSTNTQLEIDIQNADTHESTPSISIAPQTSMAIIYFSMASYFVVSLSIVFFNNWLFSSYFKFPIFVSLIQQFVGLVMYMSLGMIGKYIPALGAMFPLVPFSLKTASNILPLTVTFVGMVSAANLCLKYVQVSVYQVARSLTLFFTLILSRLILHTTYDKRTLGSVSLMVFGFIVSSFDTKSMGVFGLVAGMTSSIFQAAYNVLIKRCLKYVDNDTNVLLMYNLILSVILFTPCILLFKETGALLRLTLNLPSGIEGFSVWMSLLASGVLGTLLNISSYACVKHTSPLTFNILGFAKSCVQTVSGMVFLGEALNPQSALGVVTSLTSTVWYTWIRFDEMKEKPKIVLGFDKENPRGRAESLAMPQISLKEIKVSTGNANDKHEDFD